MFCAGDVWVLDIARNLPVVIVEGSLEVKLQTIWRDGKAEVGRVREEKEVRRSERRKSEKQEDAGAQKGRKVTIHCVSSNGLWLQRVEK